MHTRIRLYKIISVLTLLSFIHLKGYNQPEITSLNQKFKYNPESEIEISTNISENDKLFQIYIELELVDSTITNDSFVLWYTIKNALDQEYDVQSDTLSFDTHGIWSEGNVYVMKLEIEKQPSHKILVIHINLKRSQTTYNKTYLLDQDIVFPYPDFYLFESKNNIPLFRSYINELDTLQIKDISQENALYHIYYYSKDFVVADPPMYSLKKDVSRSLNIDSVFAVHSDQKFILKEKGFYFIQKDTSGLIGVPLRVQDQYFPRLASINDLYASVIYLSTNRETSSLQKAEDNKRAFDEFWLRMSKSSDKAKRIIKAYYKQVEQANKLFTGYKEGWKTDMGMVYIILGPPNLIYNNGNTEEWYYEKRDQMPGVNFTFNRIKNLFCRDHYVLIRNENIKGYWYLSIDRWRRGLN